MKSNAFSWKPANSASLQRHSHKKKKRGSASRIERAREGTIPGNKAHAEEKERAERKQSSRMLTAEGLSRSRNSFRSDGDTVSGRKIE
jgi:hypothetical protein